MDVNQHRTITVNEFAGLVARELQLSTDERVELTRYAEAVQQSDAMWYGAADNVMYYADEVYCSTREISREEAAAMLAFASDLIGEHAPKLSSQEAEQTISRFRDAKLVSAWAKPALATAVQQQWMNADHEIKPKHYMSSNEATMIVRRFATDIQ